MVKFNLFIAVQISTADIMTKAIPKGKYEVLREKLGAQATTSVLSQVLMKFIIIEDIESTLHMVQSYLKSLP
ncbi:hypothetical protein MTR67_044154 [Solanum verrucosum]|uniref:Uncharacterized protein n=1 Tax=Solanum verrucosum TaxID=315347 RepID=A0AAF0URR6_SOLVR|nr:hypothetical protein MTR67_044154 [Solanum verrucosum]